MVAEFFLSRNNITFKALSGESAQIDCQAAADWKSKVEDLLKNYAPKDRFNCDETGLFYRQIPRKSFVRKGNPSKGCKLAKQRISVLFCCSSTGEKLKPLVIGNAMRPRIFKKEGVTVETLPVIWKSNKKAWMTSEIFEEWLATVNTQMRKAKRKIVIVMDNATSHTCSRKLSNVAVEFLPPNLTCEIQPLDQGIIKAVKSIYRKKMLLFLVTSAECSNSQNDFFKSITVLHAIRWIYAAWENISPQTIRKCFRRCGFSLQEEENEEEGATPSSRELNGLLQSLPQDIRVDMLNIDEMQSLEDELVVHEHIQSTPEAVLELVFSQSPDNEINSEADSSDESENENDEPNELHQPPTHQEMLEYLKKAICYSTFHQAPISEDLFKVYNWVEEKMCSSFILKQTKISDYFNKNIE